MVNSTYIANATDFFDRMARFSSETGYLFGHGLVLLVAFYAAYRTAQYGTTTSLAYSLFFATLTSWGLWLGGWESISTVIFCGSALILVVLLRMLDQ